MSTRKAAQVTIGVSDRIKGLTLIGILGIVIVTVFLVAGWPSIWHKAAGFCTWASTVFESAK